MDTKKIRLEDLAPVIEEELAAGGQFEISIKGTSMLPLLVQGRDTVTLTAVNEPLEKYDIPLYRRKDGGFVLHRVVKAENGCYTMCGDNQWVLEKGIEHSQVIGKVCKITRKGKCFETTNSRYKLYCRVWQFLFPIRKYLIKIRGKLRK
ncbi:MAG: S24/S26 family peptidase [Clostridia bacterium]|nr:S24/S26 family peptidase [Clostridia bacterium]